MRKALILVVVGMVGLVAVSCRNMPSGSKPYNSGLKWLPSG